MVYTTANMASFEHGAHEAVIHVVVAAEQAMFREAVRAVVESQPDLDVVGEAQSGCQAAMAIARASADVAILSATLPHCDGVEATLRIGQETPGCRVIILAPD